MIDGTTRLFGILADPVAHVRTPRAFNDRFSQSGTNAVLVPFHVRPEGLASLLSGLRRLGNLGGLAVTIPHKGAAAALCDELGPRAAIVGAVNAIAVRQGRLIGENFDGLGFVAGLAHAGHGVSGRRILVAGAGGAAAAIAFALAGQHPSRLTIVNRDAARAAALAGAVGRSVPGLHMEARNADPGDFDVVVNATSLGMREGDALPVDAARMRAGAIAAEASWSPMRPGSCQSHADVEPSCTTAATCWRRSFRR